MTDLHAAIRERLDLRPISGVAAVGTGTLGHRAAQWINAASAAIEALLNWHVLGYRYGEEPGKLPNWCHACNDIGPCDTVQIIARELGIEVGGDG